MERGEYNSAQLQLQHNAHTQSVVDVVCMNFSGVNLQLSQFSYALFYTACVHITKKKWGHSPIQMQCISFRPIYNPQKPSVTTGCACHVVSLR